MYNVLIVDDQKFSRQMFEMTVAGTDNFRVAFSIDSARAADFYCAAQKIDLVIMDVVMADGFNGIDAAEKIRRISPETKIIVVTSTVDNEIVEKARSIGAHSFWYKEFSDCTLESVMERTMLGESVYPEIVPSITIGKLALSDLRPVELRILRLAAAGKTNAEISEELDASIQTVKNVITGLLKKTGFTNRTALAIEARLKGVIAVI